MSDLSEWLDQIRRAAEEALDPQPQQQRPPAPGSVLFGANAPAQSEPDQRPSSGERLARRMAEANRRQQQEERRLAEEKRVTEEAASRAEASRVATERRAEAIRQVEWKAVSAKPKSLDECLTRRRTPEEWREAVVLAEMLGPPLALREK